MPIKLLADGTPEERARMAKSAALADQLDLFIAAQNVSQGTVIEALGMLFAGKATDAEWVRALALALATSLNVCFALKEKAK